VRLGVVTRDEASQIGIFALAAVGLTFDGYEGTGQPGSPRAPQD
jgi:hypothetical protein